MPKRSEGYQRSTMEFAFMKTIIVLACKGSFLVPSFGRTVGENNGLLKTTPVSESGRTIRTGKKTTDNFLLKRYKISQNKIEN